MKIEKLVKRSLSRIEPPPARKAVMLDTILAQAHTATEPETQKVRNPKPKALIIAAAAVTVAALVVVLLITMQPDYPQSMAVASPIASQPVAEQLAGEYGDPAWLHNLVISDEAAKTSFPQELVLYEDVPIILFEQERAVIDQNAQAHGWQNIKLTDSRIDGLYFIRPDDGEPLSMTEPSGHEAMAHAFMEDSGLIVLLKSKGMALQLEEKEPIIIPENVESEEKTAEGANAESLLWSMVDGLRGSGYVRLSVSADKHVLDCKIFAVKSVPLMVTQTLTLSEAIENAFIPGGIGVPRDGNQEYTVIEAKLVYKNGVPLYELTLLIEEDTNYHPTAYALAVDKAAIDSHESALAAYARFVDEGV